MSEKQRDASKRQLLESVQALAGFRLPRWAELPDKAQLRAPVLSCLNQLLFPLFGENPVITGTMVQNYAKWGLIPRPDGRRYRREHMAYLIVLAIFKEVIPFENIRTGILLQTRLMSLEESYNCFCEQVEDSLRRAGGFLAHDLLLQQKISFRGMSVQAERLNLAFVCESFAFKRLARVLIDRDGLMGSYFSVEADFLS